jgi:hypothetical protein
MIRRINMIAGPGAGKSTTAWFVASQLKVAQIEVGLVGEHVKAQAYEGRHPQSFDQVYLLACQMKDEDLALRNGVDVIVTESPVLMSVCYGKMFNSPGWEHLLGLSRDFEKAYPSLNIFLERPSLYNTKGRFQNETGAKELDAFIRKVHEDEGVVLHDFKCNNHAEISSFVISQVNYPPAKDGWASNPIGDMLLRA